MGHLAIVNANTIKRITDQHPYISIGGTLKAYPCKTISDLFADALSVRDGDIIFTWMVDNDGIPGIGFDRYYLANGSVVFDSSDPDYPIKVGVKEGYIYENAVPEEIALNLFLPHLLWNAIGKKSLRRGRSLSHQTIDEDGQLLNLLAQANLGCSPRRILAAPIHNKSYTPITVSSIGTVQRYTVSPDAKLSSIHCNRIIWNKGNEFLYEKTLEAYLCENIDSSLLSFCNLIGHPHHHIKWLGNYLPYGVAGNNIDMVCEIEGENDEPIVVVVELKKGPVSYNEYIRIVEDQLNYYSRFIAEAFRSYRGSALMIEQVVLTHSPKRSLAPALTQHNSTKWIGYDIDPINKTVSFTRLL